MNRPQVQEKQLYVYEVQKQVEMLVSTVGRKRNKKRDQAKHGQKEHQVMEFSFPYRSDVV